MNGITTLAALPFGAGQAAHLKPEVGRQRKPRLSSRTLQLLIDAGFETKPNGIQGFIPAPLLRVNREKPTYRYERLLTDDSLRDLQTGYVLPGLAFALLPSNMQAEILSQTKPLVFPEIEG